ncbi:hypothetical protein Pa4123_68100 [Phytohabitans aurantiacus]|uniref:Uncharacterized protein n=1 Tax=Phytohabitans aurantiacus TaxID=3016789 RepID=A0ABQ5R417_9ACTN|nr:hypothetical protein Pa4123_68100 [Phytohabitans aurantiacus]
MGYRDGRRGPGRSSRGLTLRVQHVIPPAAALLAAGGGVGLGALSWQRGLGLGVPELAAGLGLALGAGGGLGWALGAGSGGRGIRLALRAAGRRGARGSKRSAADADRGK